MLTIFIFFPLFFPWLFAQLKLDIMEQEESQPGCSEIVRRAVHYIQVQFSLPISCSTVNEAIGANRTALSSAFHREMGCPMKEFILEQRLKRALWMLEKPRVKITDIARQCGFDDAGYFIKVFRRRFGRSPGAYRKRVR